MKSVVVALLFSVAAFGACTATINAPGGGTPTISGSAYVLTSTLGTCPNAYAATYFVNGEPAVTTYAMPAGGAGPVTAIWSTAYVFNNSSNFVTVTVYDALNNALATSSAVTFAVNNPGWPVDVSVCTGSFSTGTAPTSNWSGSVTFSISGTGSNCASTQNNQFIDGEMNTLNHFDSTLYDNGLHTVVMTLDDLNAPANNLQRAGQWEYQVNFQNGSVPMELRANKKEVWLCTTTQTNCPTTFTLSALVYNTDETTTAASGLTYSSGDATCITVNSSSGVLSLPGSPKAGCSTQITITDASSRTVKPWVHVNSVNTIASFGTDGLFHTTYTPGKSLWVTDSFFSQSGFGDTNLPTYANFGQKYATNYNAVEDGIWVEPLIGGCATQSAWQTCQTNYANSAISQASTYGIYIILIGDSVLRRTQDMFLATRTAPGGITGIPNGMTAWSPAAPQYTASSWLGTRVLGARMFDEGNTIWGSVPTAGQIAWGNFLGSLSCTSGSPGTCTASGTNITTILSNGAGSGIVIRGATTHSGLNSVPATVTATISGGAVNGYTGLSGGSGYVNPQAGGGATPTVAFSGGGCGSYPTATATLTAGSVSNVSGTGGSGCTSAPTVIIGGGSGQGAPYYYVASLGNNNSFTFDNPGLGAITVTSGSDPGLVIEPYPTIQGWFDQAGNTPQTTGPAYDYVRYNAFTQFVNQWRAAGMGYPLLSWGVSASGNGTPAITNWNVPAVADYATFYISPGQDYLSPYNTLFSNIASIGGSIRTNYGLLGSNRVNEPIMAEASGTNTDYGLAPYQVNITSCVGNLITFAAPHKIYNVLPANTRMWITGSSDSNCNQDMYVTDCPTTTTCHVALAAPTFTLQLNSVVTPWTATFSPSGATAPIWNLQSQSGLGNYPTFSDPFDSSNCGVSGPMQNHRGETITFTGSGISTFGSWTWWYVPAPLSSSCDGTTSSSGNMFQLPVTSGTGGVANIVQNQSYTRGLNNVSPNSEGGPRDLFGGNMYYAVLPVSATSAYSLQGYFDDPRSHDRTAQFNNTSDTNIQTGLAPYYLQYGNQFIWTALFHPNVLKERLAPLLLGQNVNGQDLGRFFESTGRTNSIGNYVGVLGFSDGTSGLTRTVDLSGCAVSGQPIEKIVAAPFGIWVTKLNAGTTSDTFNYQPDTAQFVGYACWQNYAANVPTTIISARLADVPSATKVVVQYSYLPDVFQQSLINRSMLFQSFDCGTGTCTLPVDRNIGPIFYRILYLNSSGVVLAQSDVQSL